MLLLTRIIVSSNGFVAGRLFFLPTAHGSDGNKILKLILST